MAEQPLRFLGSFLKNPARTGAVAPSSRYLARLLCGRLDVLAKGDVVVEFGPGTGPVTAAILDRLPEGVRYLGIEINPSFHRVLVQRFPGVDFHQGDASELPALLAQRGLPKPKRVISGLPFASLPGPVQDSIVKGLEDGLAEDGEFRTFQYVHAYKLGAARRFRTMMAERFPHWRRLGPVIRNMPPAYVLEYLRR